MASMAATVTRKQFFTAVAEQNGMNTLYTAISADTNYPDWIEFNSAKYIAQGDVLYVRTQLALGYTSEQMQALFDAAVQVPA
jgi:hypothetical protein